MDLLFTILINIILQIIILKIYTNRLTKERPRDVSE